MNELEPKVPFSGPIGSSIMILGEAPGNDELSAGRPFVGASGRELDSMLRAAGINRMACRIANVSKHQPPNNKIDTWISKKSTGWNNVCIHNLYVHPYLAQGHQQLLDEIKTHPPKLIIALGNVPMWALTGKWGITNWRGSQFPGPPAILSTYHPAYILRSYDDRVVVITDLRRAKKWFDGGLKCPTEKPTLINPTPQQTLDWIESIPRNTRLSFDLETSSGGISCAGLACRGLGAICIPLRSKTWTVWEEAEVIQKIKRALLISRVVGQNLLYDLQYTALWWGFTFQPFMDTMVAQNVLFPGMHKGLDFLASMYAEHYVYWKSDSKEAFDSWTPEILWQYNCKDTLYTLEISYELERLIAEAGLTSQLDFQQVRLFPRVLETMLRGMRFSKDTLHEASMAAEISTSRLSKELFVINPSTGKTPWFNSPIQQRKLFYNDLGCKPIIHRKTHQLTVDDETLLKIGKRRLELQPITDKLLTYRKLKWLKDNPLSIKTSPDGRIRTSFNIAGTETFRLSSSRDVFGASTNLQNISSGDDILPNLRKMFLPDPGHILLDCDFERADLQVVVWEAKDEDLKAALRSGEDLHNFNAVAIFGPDFTPRQRFLAKTAVHAVNYGVKERTLAVTLGVSTHQASEFISKWFKLHPGIPQWHLLIQRQIEATRIVKNAFGYRRVYLGRIDGVLPQALAWIGQSTVACVTNRAWVHVRSIPWAQVLLQVHDSLVIQIPEEKWQERWQIRDQMLVTVPYLDPLVIGVGLKASSVSWGDVKPCKWSD